MYTVHMQTIVGVLRGGPRHKHKVSLETGHAIFSQLPEQRYQTRDIFIDTQGAWYVAGRPVSPEQALNTIDIAFPVLFSEYGTIQKECERYGVPYVGANSAASAFTLHNVLSKECAREQGIKTPRYTLIDAVEGEDRKISEIISTFFQPVIIKPVRHTSSVGASIVSGYVQLYRAVIDMLALDVGSVLVEEYISGRRVTVVVIEGLRNEELYTPPPVEITPMSDEYFSTTSVRSSEDVRHICPAPFPTNVSEELMSAARTMHHALGIRHYSLSDLIVSPRGVYYLGTKTLPYLTQQSPLPISLEAVGVSMSDFLEHITSLARHG